MALDIVEALGFVIRGLGLVIFATGLFPFCTEIIREGLFVHTRRDKEARAFFGMWMFNGSMVMFTGQTIVWIGGGT